MQNSSDFQIVHDIARRAGERILAIYEDEAVAQRVDLKADQSPLTLADRESHRIIVTELQKHYPAVPVLSEEGQLTEYEVRRHWPRYWLVDPLDGTREFIQRNGEFTVNIALVEQNRPVAGVIYAPTLRRLYFATPAAGAYRQEAGHPAIPIRVSGKTEALTVVRSRSHGTPEEDQVLRGYAIGEQVTVGSSLKFCLIAEGTADLYYRHGPTMEWDTAAGQAILQIAGGTVAQLDGSPVQYNKFSLVNPGFICWGSNSNQPPAVKDQILV
ncbi:MAG: 3'(2'),5'-bisphosphate nucleotidase CysQ [Ferruginibacter sp.]|nr:3'(2'),5'-bisphosphate nucleotidase CysQ [Cytophagales bacterium]